jgi:hypothetical protein
MRKQGACRVWQTRPAGFLANKSARLQEGHGIRVGETTGAAPVAHVQRPCALAIANRPSDTHGLTYCIMLVRHFSDACHARVTVGQHQSQREASYLVRDGLCVTSLEVMGDQPHEVMEVGIATDLVPGTFQGKLHHLTQQHSGKAVQERRTTTEPPVGSHDARNRVFLAIVRNFWSPQYVGRKSKFQEAGRALEKALALALDQTELCPVALEKVGDSSVAIAVLGLPGSMEWYHFIRFQFFLVRK